MTDRDPTVPPATPPESLEALAANASVPGFFEGTNVPELRLEQDAEWLGVVLPRHVLLDNDIIDRLNFEANCSEGLSINRVHMQQEAKRTPMIGSAYMAPQDGPHAARRRFYHTISGGHPPRVPRNGIDAAAKSDKRPSQTIELARVLHEVVGGEYFDEILINGRYFFRRSNPVVLKAMHAITAGNVDLRAVLLESPNTIINNRDEAKLVELARVAEARYKRKLTAVARGSGAIVMPTIKRGTGETSAEVRNPHHYARLANISGIPADMLQTAFPAVDRMDPEAFADVVGRVADFADEDLERTLRIRDIAPFMPQAPKKEST